MPRPIGSPITVTNGQPQREVERFQVFVTYDAAGVPHFQFQAFTLIRLRDAQGAIVYQQPGLKQLVDLADADVPAAQRTQFTAILTKLDTLQDPS